MKKDQKHTGNEHNKKKKRGATAAQLDAIINSPTDAARSRRHTDEWSNQGTNISYEGPTAPGGGGAVGTGYASGQDAVGARISTNDGNDSVSLDKRNAEEEKRNTSGKKNDDLDRDTLGTP